MNQDSQEKLKIILPILQGLLASGKYTVEADCSDAVEVVKHLRFDWGKDYDRSCTTRRHSSLAIEDAVDLADELIAEMELVERLKKEVEET